jgi:hypothetical protein
MAEEVPTIASSAMDLSELEMGQRAWFWLSPDLDFEQPILLLSSFKEDPLLDELKNKVSLLSLPEGCHSFSGILTVDTEGHMQFGGKDLQKSHLRRLAAWVQQNISEHPDLAYLRHSTMIELRTDGMVLSTYRLDRLWEQIPHRIVAGTINESVKRLKRAKKERNYWFWMAQSANKKSFLYIDSSKKDKQGELFAKRVNLFQRQNKDERSLSGIFRRTEGGMLILSSQEPVERVKALCLTIIEDHSPLLDELKKATLIQTKEGKFNKIIQVEEKTRTDLDLSQLVHCLKELDDTPLWFWFGFGGKGLLLNHKREALKSEVAKAASNDASILGQVYRTSSGRLEFLTRKPFGNLIDELAHWTKKHIVDWPALSLLKGARVVQKNREGEIVNRDKNRALWRELIP